MFAVLTIQPSWAKGARDVGDVKKDVATFLKSDAVNSVRRLSVGDLYEIVLNDGRILYTDKSVSYISNGEIVSTKDRKNLTAESKEKLSRIDFASLPLKQAFKRVNGSGARVIAVFEDANCTYCKRLEKELASLQDVTIYTFMVGIINDDSLVKAKRIWCSNDQAASWIAWMNEGKAPEEKSCEDVIDENQVLGAKVRISGTPTIFLSNGTRLVGYVSHEKLEAALAAVVPDKETPAK
jgi:thiol:disulfide interchange protein DsbC